MNRYPLFRAAAVFDPGHLMDPELLLTRAERVEFENLPTERRKRHYLIGRMAARNAVRRLLGAAFDGTSVAILSEPDSAPCVTVDGKADEIAVSISHSGHLAVACVWPTRSRYLISAGVDLEHVRPNEVAESRYAYSRRERALLARLPEGPEILGLAGWAVKESVWKALLASQAIGPDAIDIYALSLEKGFAAVRVKRTLAETLGDAQLDVRIGIVEHSGERYVLSFAQVIASRSTLQGRSAGLLQSVAGPLKEIPV